MRWFELPKLVCLCTKTVSYTRQAVLQSLSPQKLVKTENWCRSNRSTSRSLEYSTSQYEPVETVSPRCQQPTSSSRYFAELAVRFGYCRKATVRPLVFYDTVRTGVLRGQCCQPNRARYAPCCVFPLLSGANTFGACKFTSVSRCHSGFVSCHCNRTTIVRCSRSFLVANRLIPLENKNTHTDLFY